MTVNYNNCMLYLKGQIIIDDIPAKMIPVKSRMFHYYQFIILRLVIIHYTILQC